MRDQMLIAGVVISLLLSVVATVLSISGRIAPTDLLTRFGVPDDADIATLRVRLDIIQKDTAMPAPGVTKIDEFVVDAKHIPRIMHFFRPMAAVEHYDFGPRMGSLTIESRSLSATLELDFYDWGQNPVVFTADHEHWFVGNPWRSNFGEWAVERAISAAYAESVADSQEELERKLPNDRP